MLTKKEDKPKKVRLFAQDGETADWITIEMSKAELDADTYPVNTGCSNCGATVLMRVQKGIPLERVSCLTCETARLFRIDTKGGKRWFPQSQ